MIATVGVEAALVLSFEMSDILGTRSSGFELVKSMIPVIVGELGNTVKRRSFTTR